MKRDTPVYTCLVPESVVLVIIDIQGKLAQLMYKKNQLFKNVIRLIKGIKVLDIPILWLEQYPRGLGRTVDEIAEHLQDYDRIEKIAFSACGSDEFMQKLEALNPSHAVVCGIETHIFGVQKPLKLVKDVSENPRRRRIS